MLVKELQPFLADLARFLETTGGKTVAKDLARFSDGLAPFAELTIAQLAEFLAVADEYRRTGVVGGAKQGKGSAKPLDEKKVIEWTQRLSKLREEAISESVSYSQIEAEVARLAKENGKPELTAIAKELGLSGSYKTKKDAQTAIHRLIAERKESFQRTQFGGR